MKDYKLIILIILIISTNHKINSIESFNDLFKKQKEIYNLVKDIKKFQTFFNLNETYLDELSEEEKYNQKLMDSEKQNNLKENNIMEVQIVELGKFIQTNIHIIIFNVLIKFEGISPSEKISFTLQCYTKTNEKSDSKAKCHFLEFGKNPQIGFYKCRSEVKDKISYILPYDDFIFEKNKNKIKDPNKVLEEEIEMNGEDTENLENNENENDDLDDI